MRFTNSIKSTMATLFLTFGFLCSAQNPKCDPEKSHQFDFWIGEWTVTANGTVAGHNSIQPILDGCVLQETWTGSDGSKGTSLNFYNPSTKKWTQFWVYQNGISLPLLTGGLKKGSMVLEGKGKDRSGKGTYHKITWIPNEDGSVRQHWEISKDKGKSWSTAFDGLYTRKK